MNESEINRDPDAFKPQADPAPADAAPNESAATSGQYPTVEVIPPNRPRKVYSGMWGRTELIAFGLALSTVLIVLALYLFLVVPSNNELAQSRAQRDSLEQELNSAKAKYGDITNTETQVAKLVASANDFESAYLPIASTGRTALYQRLNGLIAGYGLVNTSGPNFAPLDISDGKDGTGQGSQSDTGETGREKFRSTFPGVYVTMTLEGSYQNLRRFIRDIETGSEFVVISSVELEPTETKKKEEDNTQPPTATQPVTVPGFPSNPSMRGGGFRNPTTGFPIQQQQPRPAQPQGKTHGETVSLRLEMAAYFRRDNVAEPAEESEK